MTRQSLPVGAHGTIHTKQLDSGLWESLTRYRDPDGELRRVRRTAGSKSGSRNELQKALASRRHNAGADLTGETRLSAAGERWLQLRAAEVEAGDLAPRTHETYASAWRLHVEPALGALRLREVSTSRCEAWLIELRRRKGPSMCKTARSVLSGVLAYAARMDAIAGNPVRDLSRVPGGRTRKPRAMTRAERAAWLAWMDSHVAHDPAKRRRPELAHPADAVISSRALGDITRLMLATGCRIGEAMALSWDEVDLDAGTVAIRWHIVRVRGEGLLRMEGAKSDAGDRVLRVPRWCTDMLMRRRVDPHSGYPIFPALGGGWRDPNQVMRWIRWSRDEAGFEWVSSHIFRMTVIHILDEAGLTTREVADQAGHATIQQTQQYMQRRVASDAAAEVLEDLL